MKDLESYKYKAFISYSHQDMRWGNWLEKFLSSYRIPKRLVGKNGRDGLVPERLGRIFQDEKELPGVALLAEGIDDALKQSEYLIVICSPRAARSKWINKEVLQFKAMGRENRILALTIEGEPNATDKIGAKESECFPPALRHKVDNTGTMLKEQVEPLAPDVRRRGKKTAALRIVAGLLGIDFDDLNQLEQTRKLRRLQAMSVAAISLASVIAFLAVGLFFAREEATTLQHQFQTRNQELLTKSARNLTQQGETGRALQLLQEAIVSAKKNPKVGISKETEVALEYALSQHRISADLQGHTAAVNAWDVSSDGSKLVTTSEDQTTRLWDINSSREITQFNFPGRVKAVSFLGETLDVLAFVEAQDDSWEVWRSSQNKGLPEKIRTNADFHYISIDGFISFTPDGQKIFFENYLVDIFQEEEPTYLGGQGPRRFTPSGDKIIIDDFHDGCVYLYDLQTNQTTILVQLPESIMKELPMEGRALLSSISPNGRYLLVNSTMSAIIHEEEFQKEHAEWLSEFKKFPVLIDLETGDQVDTDYGNTLAAFFVSPDRILRFDYTANSPEKIELTFSDTDGTNIKSYTNDGSSGYRRTMYELTSKGNMTTSNKWPVLVSINFIEEEVRFINTSTGAQQRLAALDIKNLVNTDFLPNGHLLLFYDDGTIRAWDPSPKHHLFESYSMQELSPNGRMLFSWEEDFVIRDLPSLELHSKPELDYQQNEEYRAKFTLNDKRVVITRVPRQDSTDPSPTLSIEYFDTDSGKRLASFKKVARNHELSFSDDGALTAFVDSQSIIHVIEHETCRERIKIISPELTADPIFSPDSKYLVLKSRRGETDIVSIHSVDTGQMHWQLPEDNYQWVAFSPVSSFLVTASPGIASTVSTWEVSSKTFVDSVTAIPPNFDDYYSIDKDRELTRPFTFSKDGRYLIYRHMDLNGDPDWLDFDFKSSRLCIWDLMKGELHLEFTGVHIPHNLDQLVLDTNSQKIIGVINPPRGGNPDDSITMEFLRYRVGLWDIETGKLNKKLRGRILGFEHDNSILALVEARDVLLYDLTSTQIRSILSTNGAFVRDIRFSSDGTLLFAQTDEGLMMWERPANQTALIEQLKGAVDNL